MDKLEIAFYISIMAIMSGAIGTLVYGIFVISQVYLKILGA